VQRLDPEKAPSAHLKVSRKTFNLEEAERKGDGKGGRKNGVVQTEVVDVLEIT